MTRDRAIRSIAIAGSGIIGLSAAAAFSRALAGVSITLIDCASADAAIADRVAVGWPGIERFHAAIGIDEQDLIRRGAATHHLGTIFENWSASKSQWVHAFGSYGKPAGAIPFDQIWWRVRASRGALPYDHYSIGAALARAGKFVHPARDSQSLGSRFSFGLRLHPELYRDQLKQHLTSFGVALASGEIRNIENGARGIEALELTDGDRIEADLFVDCTGPSAVLIRAVDDSFEDWSAWMPFDRLSLESIPTEEIPQTADCVRASAEGWSLRSRLPQAIMHAEMTIGGPGVALVRGRRLRPWARNVLALGDAATALDPLHGMNLDLAQRAILLALELLPGRDFNPLETEEYNRRAELLTRRARDFAALHYLRSGRAEGVWSAFAERDIPDSLARTLNQYEYRARLPYHEEESITPDSWTAALLGLGVHPEHADPQAIEVPLEEASTAMGRLSRDIDETIARLPAYRDYLATMVR